jgi:hypothetical protein
LHIIAHVVPLICAAKVADDGEVFGDIRHGIPPRLEIAHD